MNPRNLRIGVMLGAAIAIVATFIIRHGARSPAGRESEATQIAPPPAPPAPPSDDTTRVTRAPAPPAVPPAPRPTAENEATATVRARDLLRSDPDGALAALDTADRAYPDGRLAEQRAAMRVDALVFAQRIGLARDAAEVYLARYPNGPQAQRIEMLTGVHPRPAN